MHKSVFSSRVRPAGFPWGNEIFMEIRDLSLIPTMRKKCDVKNPYGGSLNLSYNFIYSFQKTSCFLQPPCLGLLAISRSLGLLCCLTPLPLPSLGKILIDSFEMT